MEKPNCYKCKYRRDCVGSAHSSCVHPKSGIKSGDAMLEILSILSSARGIPSQVSGELNVVGNPYGIRNGWFSFPYNFDPVWLESCDGFESIEVKEDFDEKIGDC